MIINHQALTMAGAIATMLSPLLMTQGAIAQSSIRECLNEFVRQGVSPDKAADLCSSGGLAIERCVQNKRFQTYEGAPRQRTDGKTEYTYPINAFSAESTSGTQCWTDYRKLFNPKNVCWASSIKVSVLSEEEAVNQCRNAVGGNPVAPVSNPNLNTPLIIIPGGGGTTWTNPVGGSPQAIQQCMENLLYRTEVQKPFSGWICVGNDVNCKTVRVRTEISEAAAVQACQNAR
ncbi:MAG: hypothetical protein ACM65M_27280 [Microcoleus sp.]